MPTPLRLCLSAALALASAAAACETSLSWELPGMDVVAGAVTEVDSGGVTLRVARARPGWMWGWAVVEDPEGEVLRFGFDESFRDPSRASEGAGTGWDRSLPRAGETVLVFTPREGRAFALGRVEDQRVRVWFPTGRGGFHAVLGCDYQGLGPEGEALEPARAWYEWDSCALPSERLRPRGDEAGLEWVPQP